MAIIDWMIEYLPFVIFIAALFNPMTGNERNPNGPSEGAPHMDGTQ